MSNSGRPAWRAEELKMRIGLSDKLPANDIYASLKRLCLLAFPPAQRFIAGLGDAYCFQPGSPGFHNGFSRECGKLAKAKGKER
ncbi:MAG: hypothetical protein AB7U82_34435 [Blastocatellales bacterium]